MVLTSCPSLQHGASGIWTTMADPATFFMKLKLRHRFGQQITTTVVQTSLVSFALTKLSVVDIQVRFVANMCEATHFFHCSQYVAITCENRITASASELRRRQTLQMMYQGAQKSKHKLTQSDMRRLEEKESNHPTNSKTSAL